MVMCVCVFGCVWMCVHTNEHTNTQTAFFSGSLCRVHYHRQCSQCLFVCAKKLTITCDVLLDIFCHHHQHSFLICLLCCKSNDAWWAAAAAASFAAYLASQPSDSLSLSLSLSAPLSVCCCPKIKECKKCWHMSSQPACAQREEVRLLFASSPSILFTATDSIDNSY